MKKKVFRSGASAYKMNRWQHRAGKVVFTLREEERDFLKNNLGPTMEKEGFGG